jgi:hypothetical protein
MFFKAILSILSISLIIVCMPVDCFSQQVEAIKIDAARTILIDGRLSESEWGSAKPATGFTQFEPVFGSPASYKTFIKVLYNDTMIVFGIDCRDPEPARISSKVTKRDGEVWEDDSVALVLDTYNDNSNAYFFIVNSLGTQQDERWADNGRTRDVKWDIKWSSAGTITPGGWSAEIAIPFSSIKFDRNTVEWGLNVIRYMPRNLEMSHWIKGLTEWFRISEIGAITQLDLTDVSGKRVTVIPYIQAQFAQEERAKQEIGGDIRFLLSSNLGMDVTINPDFATIEGDVEQVNLTRFELSYPEKRPFFMEGAENYLTRIKQFYSRRIGEIPWGFKLNGKIKSWKFNFLNTQSDPATANPTIAPGNNALYSVFRINHEMENASNIGIIGANRHYMGKNKGSVGLVSTLFFTNVLGMTSQIIKSYGLYSKGSWTYFFRPSYDSKTGHFHVRYTHVGENVRENMNDIGFIRDDDRREVDSNIRKKFWINKHGIEEISPSINYNQYWSHSGVLRSWEVRNNLSVKFRKKWTATLKYNDEFKRYEKDFRNNIFETNLKYDNNKGSAVFVNLGIGHNFDRDFNQIGGGIDLKIRKGWNLTYQIKRYWFTPNTGNDNNILHFIRSTYYMNKDVYWKLFYQSRYDITEGASHLIYDLSRETLQFVFVWRFLPPFGSVQIAFQQGTTRVTDIEGREKTLFTKLSWVF